MPRQSQALGHAEDVGIDREGLLTECVPQNHVRGLQSDAWKIDQRLATRRHLATVLVDKRACHADQGPRFGPIESGRANLAL